jgi:hypothetical protein
MRVGAFRYSTHFGIGSFSDLGAFLRDQIITTVSHRADDHMYCSRSNESERLKNRRGQKNSLVNVRPVFNGSDRSIQTIAIPAKASWRTTSPRALVQSLRADLASSRSLILPSTGTSQGGRRIGYRFLRGAFFVGLFFAGFFFDVFFRALLRGPVSIMRTLFGTGCIRVARKI